jgi:hypothetical protein
MKHNTSHINYTAADIQRYIEGKMSPVEMNRLEKAALDDPFLYEAIEGYQGMPAEEWTTALADLKAGFAAGQKGAAPVVHLRQRRYGWVKYAAAVLLLGTGFATFYLLNRPGKPNGEASTVAVAETTPSAAPTLPSPTDSAVTWANKGKDSLGSLQNNTFANATTVTPVDPGSVTFKQLLQKSDTNTYAVNAEPSASNNHSETVVTAPTTGITEKIPAKASGAELNDYSFNVTPAKPELVAPAAAKAAEDAKKKELSIGERELARLDNTRNQKNFYNQQTLNNSQGIMRDNNNVARNNNDARPIDRSFVAQVVDANNNPLPFANINVKNEGLGTYADAKGNVRLVSTDSVLPIEVNSMGFEPRSFVLRSGDQPVTLRLKEDNNTAYEEKSVAKQTSSNLISRRAFLQRDLSQNAEPADGWEKYDTYISNNLVIPDDLVKRNIHGEVALSFEVQSNGRITNIKVDKSLCNDCDEIAKRIVEQGPQWKVKKGKKAKARVTVQF